MRSSMKKMINTLEDGTEPKKLIYTIGHSNRTLVEYIEILKTYGIKTVIDVRRFPTSKKYPWFSKDIFEKKLKESGIEYIWLGNLLGGYREGGYTSHMNTRDYQEGIKYIRKLRDESSKKIAIMCSERLWFKCHRRFISDTLVKLGYNIVHIIDLNKISIHKETTP